MTEIVVRDPTARRLLGAHDLAFARPHTDLDPGGCVCAKVLKVAPNLTGEISSCCGAMAVRTGTCTTCTSCGSAGGCG